MLGSLARHLRFYGFDVIYTIGFTHRQIESEAKTMNIPLITTAREHSYSNCWQLPDIFRGNVYDQLNYLFTYYKLYKLIDLNHSRCGLCNTLLEEITDIEKIKNVLPQKTLNYYLLHSFGEYLTSNKKFLVWYCLTCNKYYWSGSHWQNILLKVAQWVNQ